MWGGGRGPTGEAAAQFEEDSHPKQNLDFFASVYKILVVTSLVFLHSVISLENEKILSNLTFNVPL